MLYCLKRLLLAVPFVLSIFLPAGWAGAAPVNTMPYVSLPMLHEEYWINKLLEPDKVIMNVFEIQAFNNDVRKKLPYLVYDLASYPASLDREQLTALVTAEPFPEEKLFIGSKEAGSDLSGKLKLQRNVEAITERNAVRYGFTVKRTSLKGFPTSETIGCESNDPEFDIFQYTAVLPFEPVVILHQSLDGRWYFVQTYNCAGWLPAEDLALTQNREVWLSCLRPQKFLMVTGNRINLCQNPYTPALSDLELDMGTKIPLLNREDVPTLIDNQSPSGNYVVRLPIRSRNGQLEFKLALVPMSRDVTEGYLPYTRANILRQAFKMEGDRYGWGGMLKGRDCSAMMMEVFRCFGLQLPRNSEAQAVSAGKTLSLKGYSIKNRQELLRELEPGASLHFPGHVMMYLGEENGRFYVINDLGLYATFDRPGGNPNLVVVNGVVINELTLTRKNGRQWIEEMAVGKQIEKSTFTDLEGHWAKNSVLRLADKFVVRGRGGYFDPDGTITRGEFAVMLARSLGLNPDRELAAGQFEDVSEQWYAGSVGAVAGAGLMVGNGDGRFDPDAPLTRAKIAVILAKLLKDTAPQEYKSAKAEETMSMFTDSADIPQWDHDKVAVVAKLGIISGRTPDRLYPEYQATRGEAVVMLCRFLDIKEPKN